MSLGLSVPVCFFAQKVMCKNFVSKFSPPFGWSKRRKDFTAAAGEIVAIFFAFLFDAPLFLHDFELISTRIECGIF